MTDHSNSDGNQEFVESADGVDAVVANMESEGAHVVSACDAKSSLHKSVRFGKKVVYTTCYMLSYGVCFPVFVAARYVPKNNQFVHGLIDGSEAAKVAVDEYLKRAEEQRLARQNESDSLGGVAAAVLGAEALAAT